METLLLAAWLSGCRQITRGAEVIEEQWMALRGGIMPGMARAVRGDRVISTESTTLRVRDGRLVYEANPSGQAQTVFTATSTSSGRLVFENPAPDYPRRVEYPFQRVDCGR